MAAAAFIAEVATWGSEASTMTWTLTSRRVSRRAKSGGMTMPTLAVPLSIIRVNSRWLPASARMSKYWLLANASKSVRASTLPD